MESIKLTLAALSEMEQLIPLVRQYHTFEGIESTEDQLRKALRPLLNNHSDIGKVWLIHKENSLAGYITLCFGYSIEFFGRDAFIDEFFLKEEFRGEGIGSEVLRLLKLQLPLYEIKALHLEVANSNIKAEQFYQKHGFINRSRYHLMTLTVD